MAQLPIVWGLPCDCCASHLAALALEPGRDIEAAADAPPPPPPLGDWEPRRAACRHFLRAGACLYGDGCRFAHDAAAPGAEAPAAGRRTWGGRRRAVRKSGKAGSLRRFLLETFGEEALRGRGGVLDIAGGNGELAFQLVNLNGVRTTVIDPRPLRIDRFARKWRWGVYHDTTPLQRYNSEPGGLALRAPGHLRAFLDAALLEPLLANDGTTFRAALAESRRRASKVDWTGKGIQAVASEDAGRGGSGHEQCHRETTREQDQDIGGDEGDGGRGECATVAPAEPQDASVVEALLRGAACIVGLHPDQAAGAALDLALALGVPAAVVPCCVYAADFPERQLPSGAQVRSHEDLVEWLLAKEGSKPQPQAQAAAAVPAGDAGGAGTGGAAAAPPPSPPTAQALSGIAAADAAARLGGAAGRRELTMRGPELAFACVRLAPPRPGAAAESARPRLLGASFAVAVKLSLAPGAQLDFEGLRERVAEECKALHERVLLPERATGLQISRAAGQVVASFSSGGTRFEFPERDCVHLAAASHASPEELAEDIVNKTVASGATALVAAAGEDSGGSWLELSLSDGGFEKVVVGRSLG